MFYLFLGWKNDDTNFEGTLSAPNSSDRIEWRVPIDMLTSSVASLTVHRPSFLILFRTKFDFYVDGHPGGFSMDVRPPPERLDQSKITQRLSETSRKDHLINSNVSVAFLPIMKQNAPGSHGFIQNDQFWTPTVNGRLVIRISFIMEKKNGYFILFISV